MRRGQVVLAWLILLVAAALSRAQEEGKIDEEGKVELAPVPKVAPPEVLKTLPVAPAPPPPKIWGGGLELGLSGAQGNSDNFNFRIGGNAKRETSSSITKTDFLYSYASQNSIRSENRGQLDGRQEWPFPNNPLSVFVSGQAAVDEFKAYELRLSAHSGMGYDFWKNDKGLFKGRLGAGGSQEYGGPNNRFEPEGLAGIDLEHRFNQRYKVVGTFEYYPGFRSLGDYRLQGKAAVEVLIDPDWNLTLRVGAQDRYDSTPEGRRPNDIEYFAVLLWKF